MCEPDPSRTGPGTESDSTVLVVELDSGLPGEVEADRLRDRPDIARVDAVAATPVERVRDWLTTYDWGCIWCDRLFQDDEPIHDHDHGFDRPICPECSDNPDLAPIDVYLLKEVLDIDA